MERVFSDGILYVLGILIIGIAIFYALMRRWSDLRRGLFWTGRLAGTRWVGIPIGYFGILLVVVFLLRIFWDVNSMSGANPGCFFC